jgi:triacylglycerol lipase
MDDQPTDSGRRVSKIRTLMGLRLQASEIWRSTNKAPVGLCPSKFLFGAENNRRTMIASLQKFFVFAALAAVVLAIAVSGVLGQVGWGVVAGLLLLSGYALILAVEFCLLCWTRGGDLSPKPSMTQLVRAWWGEVGHAPRVFVWRQPFCQQRWPDHLPASGQGRRGVLLVHGFFCNRGLWNNWLGRLTAMDVPFVAVTMEPPFGDIDRYANMIELAVQRLRACTGQAPVVVAHSMGGLAVRRWWADQVDASRIHRLITLGTPHHGTWLARWAFSVNGRQMRVNSPWLQALAQREPPGRSAHCTCFFSHCDNIVFPPSTAMLAGANNQHLQGVAHVHMVDHARPWEETLRHVVNDAATSPHLAR